ncbi:trehalose-phosphatase [Pseudonocardia xishanensis]|uniref:Trehalose 6-phosphate phosphatase n=1 Tax=Pseudonocardia xishanensis TaxID=630995 RepID=A0ABP8RD37_9PSEU
MIDLSALTGPLLIALDFDGVLSPIVPVPSDARPLPESAAAVRALAEAPDTTVVLVSGRGLADLATVSGLGPPVGLVGSHGGEFGPGLADEDDALLTAEQQTLKDKLTHALADLVDGAVGVTLEDKPAGVAVHVRNAEPEVGARVLDAVRSGPCTWAGVDAIEGKAVIDLAVLQATKGTAVEALREKLGVEAVLFAGDDTTDETVFRSLRPGDIGIKVGDGETAATHRVADPRELAGVLTELTSLRRTPRGA